MFVAATHVNNFMSQPLSGMLNVLPDGVPTLLEEIFGFKQGSNTFLFSCRFVVDVCLPKHDKHMVSLFRGTLLRRRSSDCNVRRFDE